MRFDARVWARVTITLAVGAALAAIIYALTSSLADTGVAQQPATCVATQCFCEAQSEGFPEQLANSLSSFAFVFVGVWALVSTRQPPRGTRERILRPYFAVTMLFLGASSFFYHATLSYTGQFLDVFSMYAFGLLLAVGALYRCGRLSGRMAVVIFVAAATVLGVSQYAFPDARRILFALILLPGIILELSAFVTGFGPRSPKVIAIYVGVALMLGAFVIWILDQDGILCDPHSPLQGHALWHTLTALAAYAVLIHHRLTPHMAR